MISFVLAHGYDPGPTQRPLLAGAITGALASFPAAVVFVGFGSLQIMAAEMMQMETTAAAALMLAFFTAGGALYGAIFQRAANDRRAGWLMGMSFGFILWIAAPILALPLILKPMMTAGDAAIGLFAGFLTWGLAAGLLFPRIHRPLHARVDGGTRKLMRLGPSAAESDSPDPRRRRSSTGLEPG